jgi:hypothetical protein
MLQALDRYADESRVYQISGYMFRIKNPAQPDAFFVPLTTSWGWATWNRAWHAFDSDAAAAAVEKLADPQVRRRFDLDNSSDRATMMHQRAVNQNDSWAILWWWAVFQINGLVLYPRKSLVWVGGFDDSGTHNRAASKVQQDDLELFSRNRLSQPIRLPAKIIADDTVFDKIKSFLRKQRKREEQRTLDAYLRRGVKDVSHCLSARTIAARDSAKVVYSLTQRRTLTLSISFSLSMSFQQRPLRVCLDARLISGTLGGIEQFVIGLADGLSKLNDGDEEYFFSLMRHPPNGSSLTFAARAVCFTAMPRRAAPWAQN